jgi:hypothetical protein
MLGTVTMLRRYPVKSMLGEDVPASDVTGKGLAHDRALALVHRETGKVASAKNPRLWRGLLKLAAVVDTSAAVSDPGDGRADAAVRITLPDGKTVCSADPGIDAVLSEVLGQPVTLTGTRQQPMTIPGEGVRIDGAACMLGTWTLTRSLRCVRCWRDRGGSSVLGSSAARCGRRPSRPAGSWSSGRPRTSRGT